MKPLFRRLTYVVLLVAGAFLLPCTVGCEIDPVVSPLNLPRQADGGASPAPDLSPPDPLPRLQAMPGQEWWWQNPREQSFLEDYVEFLWGPLSWRPRTYPKSYEPMWDRQLKAKCLFLLTVDAGWRCLPALPQMGSPMITMDGFYAASSRRPCWHYDDWRFALPLRDDARYLVLYDIDAAAYRVFEAIPETGTVLRGEYAPPASYPACTQARGDLHYFRKGKEVPAILFSALHEDARAE